MRIRIEVEGQTPQVFESFEKVAEWIVERQVSDPDRRIQIHQLRKEQRQLLKSRAWWNRALTLYHKAIEWEYANPRAVVKDGGYVAFQGPKDAVEMIEGLDRKLSLISVRLQGLLGQPAFDEEAAA